MENGGESEHEAKDKSKHEAVVVVASEGKGRSKMSDFKYAISRAHESLRDRLGGDLRPTPVSDESKRKVAEAAPEGYRWVTNEPKLEDYVAEEEKNDQKQYLDGLREKNDVYLGDAFDAKGNPDPKYQGVYIRPKSEPQK